MIELFQFFASSRHYDLFGVNDNDKVTYIEVRRELGFVLAAKDAGNLRGNSSERLAFGINNVPLLPDLFRFEKSCVG